jgi:ketosteroid isomerase-like protein
MHIRRFARFSDSFSGDATRRTLLRGLGGGGLAAAFFMSTKRPASAHGAEEVAQEAMEALNQALATGDDSGLDALFVTDVKVEPRHRMLATGEEVSPDLAGLKAALADIRGDASVVEVSVDDVIAEEDKAAGRFTFRGTLKTSGQSLEGSGLFFMVLADDQITQLWFYPDPYLMMDIMPLIGMATPPA